MGPREVAGERGAPSAWIQTRLADFDRTGILEKLGQLALAEIRAGFAHHYVDQTKAWQVELELLEGTLQEVRRRVPGSDDWILLLEFTIPRRQRRIDAVLLAPQFVGLLEFKVGASSFTRGDRWQVEDYALDLLDFHGASREVLIVPFLIATSVDAAPTIVPSAAGPLHLVGRIGLPHAILEAVRAAASASGVACIDPAVWSQAPYSPAPTIVEATRTLFRQQSVRELSHAYADNLDATVQTVADTIQAAQAAGHRELCFVTGVPGSGKTLAGLAAVHDPTVHHEAEVTAAFLSGNGPLVQVLREALIRDAASRMGGRGPARRKAELLVQNVHAFIEEYGVKHPDRPPHEYVIVFDEAQRAWNARKLQRRHPSLAVSEAALVLDIMGRKPGWAAIVAIIGGGQEIHDGEAGLEAWGEALAASPIPWTVTASSEALAGGTSVAGHRLFGGDVPVNVQLRLEPAMHLSVSVRSPRAQHLAEWVNAVLALNADAAREALTQVHGYRLALTRDLAVARRWLRDAAREDRRSGLLASSGSLRHRAYGLEMSPDFHRAYPIADWFLLPAADVRSRIHLKWR